jgi:hypothetical protein
MIAAALGGNLAEVVKVLSAQALQAVECEHADGVDRHQFSHQDDKKLKRHQVQSEHERERQYGC